jgi:hypothetical protein
VLLQSSFALGCGLCEHYFQYQFCGGQEKQKPAIPRKMRPERLAYSFGANFA